MRDVDINFDLEKFIANVKVGDEVIGCEYSNIKVVSISNEYLVRHWVSATLGGFVFLEIWDRFPKISDWLKERYIDFTIFVTDKALLPFVKLHDKTLIGDNGGHYSARYCCIPVKE